MQSAEDEAHDARVWPPRGPPDILDPVTSFVCNLAAICSALAEERGGLGWTDDKDRQHVLALPRLCQGFQILCPSGIQDQPPTVCGACRLAVNTGCLSRAGHDHAMAKDLARHLGQPDYEQVLETGQRRWLCHREDGTGSRDLTPYSPDFWLAFDQGGAYATGRNSVIRPSWNNRSDSNLAGLPIERRYAMAQPRERASATGLHMTGLMILRMGRSPLPMVSEVWVQASTIQLEPSVGWRMASLPLPRLHVEEHDGTTAKRRV